MIEDSGTPTGMASDTVSAKFAYFTPWGMTGATIKLLVKSIQGPPGSSMVETLPLTLSMTN